MATPWGVHAHRLRPSKGLRVALATGATAAWLVFAVTPLPAAQFDVNSTVDEPDAVPGDGLCSATPSGACTLRAATMEANAVAGIHTINLPAGTYVLTRTGSPTDFGTAGGLYIDRPVTIAGTGRTSTIIDGNGTDRVLNVSFGGNVTITSLTIRNGGPAGLDNGGAVTNQGALTLSDVTVTGSRATIGGGGLVNHLPFGTMTLTNVSVTGNSAAQQGGGIYNRGTLIATGLTVSGNTAAMGGGILNLSDGGPSTTATLTDSVVSGNAASDEGGGIWTNGMLSLTGVTLSGNAAVLAGGIANGGTMTLTNVTVSGNAAQQSGGGIGTITGTNNLNNVTISRNTANSDGVGGGAGGGIAIFTCSFCTPPTVNVANSVIAGNWAARVGIADDCSGTLVSQGHNLFRSLAGCTLTGDTTGNLTGVDPRLSPLTDNGGPTRTHALLTGSPAIDAGNNATCAATDQRGVARPADGNGDATAVCDIGAFEGSVPLPAAAFDFEGDRRADVAVYRRTTGHWLVRRSVDAGLTDVAWGAPALDDVPKAGDYDGDGTTDVAVYRRSTSEWLVRRSTDLALLLVAWGSPFLDDVPVPADYDGDAKTDIAVYRRSTGGWFIRRSTDAALVEVAWGSPFLDDVPVPADFDADGKADVAVYRRSTGEWLIRRSTDGGLSQVAWGAPSLGDVPVPADYEGTGMAEIAVYRRSTGEWFVRRPSRTSMRIPWGAGSGDAPAPADYDGDGITDIAVYRAATGLWLIRRSTDAGLTQIPWGAPALGDAPVSGR